MPDLKEILHQLENDVQSALETYSNVHRGTGHHSEVTTRLYEEARDKVLNYLSRKRSPAPTTAQEQFPKGKYTVIFCSPRRAKKLTGSLLPGSFLTITSEEAGVPLGITAVVVRRKVLPRGVSFETGGGTAKLIAPGWVIWEDAPALFEAGTPAIINVIAFARALELRGTPREENIPSLGEQTEGAATNLPGHYSGDPIRNPLEKKESDDGSHDKPLNAHGDPAVRDILGYVDAEPVMGKALLEKLRDTMIGKGSMAPTRGGMRPYVNFDNAASTPAFAPVWEAVKKAWRLPVALRPELMAAVRSVCATYVGAPLSDYEVIFTSNTTEAINLVAESAGRGSAAGDLSVTGPKSFIGGEATTGQSSPASLGTNSVGVPGVESAQTRVDAPANPGISGKISAQGAGFSSSGNHEPVIMTTLLEHSSNDLPWRTVRGHSVIHLPFDKEGFFDLNEMEATLRAYNEKHDHGPRRITLVALSGASNVLGSYNDLDAISGIVHRYGARLLVDAAQMIAHREVAMAARAIDYLVFSAHKAYAPFGTGVLIARKGLLQFSRQEWEEINHSGESNVGGVAALGMALTLLKRIGFDVITQEEQSLTARLLNGVKGMKKVRVFGIGDPSSPRFDRKGGVVLLDFKRKLPGRFARELAARGGIGVRYGCHCAHLAIKRLGGVPPWAEKLQGFMVRVIPGFSPPGIVRVSLGIGTTAAEVDLLIQILKEMEGGK